MSSLLQLLKYLDRDGVTELNLVTGSPATVRWNGDLRSLSSVLLTQAQVLALINGTDLERALPAADNAGTPVSFTCEGRTFRALIARRADTLGIRIARPGGGTAGGVNTSSADWQALPDLPPDGATPPPEAPSGTFAPTPTPLPSKVPSGVFATVPSRPTPPAVAVVSPPAAVPVPTPAVAPPPVAAASGGLALSAPAVSVTSEVPVVHPEYGTAGGAQAPAGVNPHLLAILTEARTRKASDVHIVAERPSMIRRMGVLEPQGQALSAEFVRQTLLDLLDDGQQEALATSGYIDLAMDVAGVGRLRVNVNRQKTGLKGCFRLIVNEPPTLESLGLPRELAKVASYHQGLAVISGPNGHGKTTTMAALVDLINSQKAVHIITVEDPIEVVHPRKKALITQRQVGRHTDSFHSALKAALREDPDVICIGELRDTETVEMALSAAETGHLVIATMSTPSGAKTIDRMIDMFPPDDQNQVRATLSGALKIVVSQRLLPAADGSRMVAAAELITGNLPLWNLIRDNKLFQLPSLQQRGRAFGMIRIEDSLKDLVLAKVITEEAAATVTGIRPTQAPPPAIEKTPEPESTRNTPLARVALTKRTVGS